MDFFTAFCISAREDNLDQYTTFEHCEIEKQGSMVMWLIVNHLFVGQTS